MRRVKDIELAGYKGRPVSERIDDWLFSLCVLLIGVCAVEVAYHVGALSVQMVAGR